MMAIIILSTLSIGNFIQIQSDHQSLISLSNIQILNVDVLNGFTPQCIEWKNITEEKIVAHTEITIPDCRLYIERKGYQVNVTTVCKNDTDYTFLNDSLCNTEDLMIDTSQETYHYETNLTCIKDLTKNITKQVCTKESLVKRLD